MKKDTEKMKWTDFIIYFIVKVRNDDIFAQGAQLAYYLVLSFFPFLIFLITLIGFSKFNSNEVLQGLEAILPQSVFDLTASTVEEVINNQNTGVLGASVLLMLWTSSSGFRAVIKGVNKAYEVKERRSFIKRAIIGAVSTLALALVIILTLAMLVFGNLIGKYLNDIFPFHKIIIFIWNVLRYLIIGVVMTSIFAVIYKYLPAERIGFVSTFPGAIFTTIGWIVVSLGFAYYVDNFSNYSRIYGSLGAVFVLMTWLYITSIIFTLGVEINSVLVKYKKINSKNS